MELQGRILRSLGGFYAVETVEGVFACRARGLFRKEGKTPYVGDRVVILPGDDGEGVVRELLPRRNCLVRPPLANLDQLLIVSSVREPSFQPFMVDKITALAEKKGIEPVLLVTKADLGDSSEIERIYRAAGIACHVFSLEEETGLEAVRALLRGKISAFTGNSGVGKSTLLNRVYPDLALATGDVSKKLGRGRHTTRHVELYPLPGGGYAADTPGFSTLDMERYESVSKEELPQCFREFAPYLGECRFTSCSHTCEKGCAVLEAVREGKIEPTRHASYAAMYREVKDRKEWETRENR